MKINIAFAINKPYLLYCIITILSIIKNSSNSDFFNINIVHDGSIQEADLNNLLKKSFFFQKCHNYSITLVDISKHKLFNKINFKYHIWTKEVFYKVLFSSLFPNLEKILYLDVDIIIKSSIADIYNTNMQDNLFLGCSIGKHHNKNINSGNMNCGILLLNLKQLRLESIENKWLDYILKYNLNEESAINIFFHNRMIYTNKFYCISKRQPKKSISKDINQAVIIHYVARKPWISKPFCKFINQPYKLWYNHLKYLVPQNKLHKYNLLSFYLLYMHKYIFSFTKRLKKYNNVFENMYIKAQNFGKNQIEKIIKS